MTHLSVDAEQLGIGPVCKQSLKRTLHIDSGSYRELASGSDNLSQRAALKMAPQDLLQLRFSCKRSKQIADHKLPSHPSFGTQNGSISLYDRASRIQTLSDTVEQSSACSR
jgi:hypothetical protein